MSTLIRVIIVIIEFLLLATYEFLHIKKEINIREKPNLLAKYQYILNGKEYKKYAIIIYPIFNLLFISLFVFTFRNHLFLCYRKLILLGSIVVLLISSSLLARCVIEVDNKSIKYICMFFLYICIFSSIVTSPMSICTSGFDFPIVAKTEENIKEITNIHNITKLNKKGVQYLINFKNANKKPIIIYDYEINSMEFSNTSIVYKITKITTKYSSELKNNNTYSESETSYLMFINKTILTDLTK